MPSVSRSRSLVHDALRLADQGVAVFPLKPRAKEPLGQVCPQGWRGAATAPHAIHEMWAGWPDANIGARPGHRYAVLDVDRRHQGDAALDRLTAERGPLPSTATVATAGGVHLWFAIPAGVSLPSRDLIEGVKGVELKARSGYVVAPGSVHPSGVPYQWVRGLDRVVEPPDWLIELALVPRRTARPERAGTHEPTALGAALRGLFSDLGVVVRCAPLVGIDAGKVARKAKFRCPVCGDDTHPSAGITRGDSGVWAVYTFHACQNGRVVWLLPELFAARRLKLDKPSALTEPQLAAWTIRLLLAAGEVPRLPEPPVSSTDPATSRAAWAFNETWTVAVALGVADPGIPFTAPFVAALTGLTVNQAEYDRHRLAAAGLIHQTGHDGRRPLWSPSR